MLSDLSDFSPFMNIALPTDGAFGELNHERFSTDTMDDAVEVRDDEDAMVLLL